MTCEYTLNGPDGQSIKLVGKPALKAYLATGNNLARLLPVRAAVLGLVKAAAKPAGVQFSRSAQIQASAKVEANVSAIKASWANAPDVVVAFDMQDPAIPDSVRREDQRQRSGGATGTPEGFYFKGKVYLISSQLHTPQDTARVLFHEALGHYGLRGVFGRSLNPVLDQIIALRKADVLAKARTYGLDTGNHSHLLQAAEEVLAEMAQSTPTIGFVQRAIAAIRTWLRQHVPSFNAMKLSDAEIIRSFIEPARAFVERGSHAGKVAAETVAFQRAYHGTPHRGIEKFSTDNIGTGEGAQAYGWGLYFAGRKEIAEWYREKLAGETIDRVEVEEHTIAGDRNWIASTVNDGGDLISRSGYITDDELRDLIGETANTIIAKAEESPGDADGEYRVGKVPGQLYEVEIPEDSDMLLWDKPLSEQPTKVRKALAGLLPQKKSDPSKMTNEELADAIMAADRDADTDGLNRKELLELADTVEAFSMADQINRDPKGLSIYHDLEAQFDSDKAASEALMANGIKGIKYLDGTSRGAGEGSHNYVIFSGDDVAIQSAMFSRSAQTNSDGFKRWFGDSKVVDADGNPLVVYHGSGVDFNAFDPGRLGDNTGYGDAMVGFHFADNAADADLYASMAARKRQENGESDANGVVRKFFLSLQNPLIIGIDENDGNAGDRTQDFLDDKNEAKSYAVDNGHDGIIYLYGTNVDSAYTAIAFSPEQIKSATENNGQFDPNNPDIRFSRSSTPPEPPQGLKLPDQNLLRRVQAAVQDSMNRVRQVQDRIEAITGKKLSEYADYYGAETNRPGRIAARKEDARNNLTGPLMEKLAKSGHTMEQLSELLHAMHAEERNKSRGKLHPEESNFFRAMTDHSIVGASGMSTDKANQIKLRYSTNRALHKLADDARSIARAALDMKRAYGLIDSDTYESLTSAYENYVPLKGDGEYGPKIKSAIGHDERDEHILEHISRDYDQAVVSGEKNLARQSLLSMVLENPDPKLWTVGVPPKGRYVAGQAYDIYKGSEKVASFDSQTQAQAWVQGRTDDPHTYIIQTDRRKFVVEKDGQPFRSFDSYTDAENYIGDIKEPVGKFEVKQSGEMVREFIKPLQDHEVMVYVDGKPVRIQIVGDESLARQLRPMDQGQMNPILEIMRTTNRYLSKIYTGYNPAFIVRNTVRDATTGTVTILGNQGVGTAAKAWANYPAAMAALSVYAATGKAPEGDAGNYLHEYRDHGGKTGASYMSDLEEQGKSLQRAFDDAKGAGAYLMEGKSGKAAIVAGRKIVGGMAHVVEVMNQATENSLRLALFMALRKQGISPGEASQAAKRVTVDFDRKGSMTGALGAIYLFFNPAVQGTANALKMLGQGEHKEQAWMALGTLAALGAYAASQGIDDDKDRWLGESWESRSKNLIIKVGSSWIKVPISQEFSPFYAAGMAMEEAKRGESKWVASGRVVSSFLSSYIPLSGIFQLDSDNHGLDAAMALTPTLLKPSLQMATNRNSFGSQVMPDNELTKDRPDNLKMFRSTKGSVYDATAQGIAKAGEALGARRYENDLTKVSPETLKMMWRTYTGGLGQFITDMAGMANIATSDRLGVSDVPIAKDFVKDSNTQAIRGRFYDLAHEVQQASTEFQQARKAGDGESIDAILAQPDRSKMLGLNKLIKATTHAAATVRDEMVSISADQKLSLAEKRAKLKQLEKVEEDIYRGALGAFK